MMWTWGASWRGPSTLTLGPGGVCAASGGAVPTSANAEMMILTDARMWPPVVSCGDVTGRPTRARSARNTKPIVREDHEAVAARQCVNALISAGAARAG